MSTKFFKFVFAAVTAGVTVWPSVSEAVAVEPLIWERRLDALQGRPSARLWHAVAYDSIRHRFVIFGGDHASSTVLGDTWEWDGSVWEQKHPAHSPSARIAASATFDASRGKVVLVGGRVAGINGPVPDPECAVWEWDGTDWTKKLPGAGPCGTVGAGFTYDPQGQRSILVGNYNTWTWNGAAWTEYPPHMADGGWVPYPPVSADPSQLGGNPISLAYDSMRQRAVLYAQGSTWEWDGATWSALASCSDTCTTTPSKRTAPLLVFNEARARTMLFGGLADRGVLNSTEMSDAWEWDGVSWSIVTPDAHVARAAAGAAYDTTLGRVLMFAGTEQGSTNELSSWDGTSWLPLAPGSSPPGLTVGFTLAYDSNRHVSVLFGGLPYSSVGPERQSSATWEWNGASWSQRRPAASPEPRRAHCVAYDAARHVMVMFGGITDQVMNDTWQWDGTTWSKRQPMTVPDARMSAALAYDSDRQVVVMFGGSAAQNMLNDTWEWNGSDWHKLTPLQNPTARAAHAMTYNRARKRVVLFGGGNTTGLNDLWEWDGTSWSQISGATSIPARSPAGFAFSPVRSRIALWGSDTLDDTWEITATAIVPHSLTPRPPVAGESSAGQAMVYDEARSRFVLFPGYGAEETWELRAAGGPCTDASQCDELTCVNGQCKSSGSTPTMDASVPDADVGDSREPVDDASMDGPPPPRDGGPEGSAPEAGLDASTTSDAPPPQDARIDGSSAEGAAGAGSVDGSSSTGGAAGAGGAGNAGRSGAGSAGAPPTLDASNDGGSSPPPSEDCSCRLAQRSSHSGASLILATLLMGVRRSRRKRGRLGSPPFCG